MLIASPLIIDKYIENITFDKSIGITILRNDLAITYRVDTICPDTSLK